MKKSVSLAMLYAGLFMAIVLEGCIVCGGMDTETLYYSFDGFMSAVVQKGDYPVNESSGAIPREHIAIIIRPDSLIVTYQQVSDTGGASGGCLYACSPAMEIVYDRLITDIRVFALQQQGDSITTGSDITSDFYADDGNGLYSELPTFLNRLKDPMVTLVYQNVPALDSISFAIRTTLSDAEIMYDTTQLVKLY